MKFVPALIVCAVDTSFYCVTHFGHVFYACQAENSNTIEQRSFHFFGFDFALVQSNIREKIQYDEDDKRKKSTRCNQKVRSATQ